MTDRKKGARLGYDPLAGQDGPRGVDSLIRATGEEQTTQGAHNTYTTQTTHKTPGKKGQRGEPLPRINMAFDPDQLEYLRTMAGLENVSITRYIYNLVAADMGRRCDLFAKITELKGDKQ